MIETSTDTELKRIETDDIREYETPKGIFPSSTTVLRLMAKQALIAWASKVSAEYAQDYMLRLIADLKEGEKSFDEIIATLDSLDLNQFVKDAKSEHKRKSQEAMDIGKRVHEVAETIFKNMITHPHDERTLDVDEDIFEACAALVTWIRDNDVKPVSVENRVWSASFGGYAGTLDLVALVNKKLLTIDLKSARNIYDDHPLQVASYDHAWEERNKGNETDGMAILRLDKEEGFPEFHLYTKEQCYNFLLEFGYWCNIWHMRKNRNELIKEANKIEREKRKEAKKMLPKIPKKFPKEDPF